MARVLVRTKAKWILPSSGESKLNSDGAVAKQSYRGDVGVVSHDDT